MLEFIVHTYEIRSHAEPPLFLSFSMIIDYFTNRYSLVEVSQELSDKAGYGLSSK